MMPVPNGSKNLPTPKKLNKITIKEFVEYMNKEGLSKQEFADILGVSVQAVNLWLKGEREINMTITKLIRAFKRYPKLLKEF